MSRTYRFPNKTQIPLTARVSATVVRAEALQRALSVANAGVTTARDRNELWSLILDRGCPPAKAVAIVTGVPVWRVESPRAVA